MPMPFLFMDPLKAGGYAQDRYIMIVLKVVGSTSSQVVCIRIHKFAWQTFDWAREP